MWLGSSVFANLPPGGRRDCQELHGVRFDGLRFLLNMLCLPQIGTNDAPSFFTNFLPRMWLAFQTASEHEEAHSALVERCILNRGDPMLYIPIPRPSTYTRSPPICARPCLMSLDFLTRRLPYLDCSFPNAQIVNAILTCCGSRLISTNTHGKSVSGK